MKPIWFDSVPAVEVPGAIFRLAQARTRIVRLLRALDAIGVDPRRDTPLRHPLVKLVECDVVLLGNVARMRRGRSSPRHLAALVPRLVEISDDKRRRLKQALPPDRHQPLLHALGRALASEEETFLEADALDLVRGVAHLGGIPLPLDEVAAAHLAEHGWGTVLPWPWDLSTSHP